MNKKGLRGTVEVVIETVVVGPSTASPVVLVEVFITVHAANVPARSPAVSRRTVHEAVDLIDDVPGTVETVVIAGTGGNRTCGVRVVRCGRVVEVPADIVTRGGRITDVRATITLAVNGMKSARTVTRVVVAPAIDVVAAKVFARVPRVDV